MTFEQNEIVSALDLKTLVLIVLPTEACNFRCSYCYENFAHGPMKPELVTGITRLIDRRISKLEKVGLSWFGGEPLLEMKTILRVSEHVQRRCSDAGVENMGGVVTTNGFLLDSDTARKLCSFGQNHFQVALDGWRNHHDATRSLSGGSGTFERIWRNLLSLQESDLDFSVMLRVHLGTTTEANTRLLCTEINRQFGGDDRFNVYFRKIGAWGDREKAGFTPLTAEEAKIMMVRLAAALPDVPNNSADRTGASVCYAARPNTWLIRADGRVGRCTVALDLPENTVGRLSENGELLVNKERLRPWMSGFGTMNQELLSCPYKGFPSQLINT